MFNNLFIAAAKTGLSSWIPTILIYVVLIGGLFWWSSRRRKQANEQQQKMRTGLVKGAQVVTIGGLHGVVDSIDTEKKSLLLMLKVFICLSSKGRSLELSLLRMAAKKQRSPRTKKKRE